MSDIDWSLLTQPFAPTEIKWRVQGKPSAKDNVQLLAYIDSRAVMDRLDAAVGPGRWQHSYRTGANGGTICRIEIEVEPGKWVGKEDGAENTDIEAVKGGLSDAFKRAAVHWGVGRYLYRLESSWVPVVKGKWANGSEVNVSKDRRHYGKASPPRLPQWALPPSSAQGRQEQPAAKATRQASHHPSWDANRAKFCAQLREMGFTLNGLNGFLQGAGKPRASHLTQEQRNDLMKALGGPLGPKVKAAQETKA